MPKGLNLKNFARRRSSGNALDFDSPDSSAPAEPSFRVIERPGKKQNVLALNPPRPPVTRPFDSPLQHLRGRSEEELAATQRRSLYTASDRPPHDARGSGATTASGSSGHYDSSNASARYSSSSTLPSSLDQEREPEDESLFPNARRKAPAAMSQLPGPPMDEPLPPPPSFTARAVRAFSFTSKSEPKNLPPVPPAHINRADSPGSQNDDHNHNRERATTTSSYASTARPAQTELTLGIEDFGSDNFGSMFDDLKGPLAPPQPSRASFHRTVSAFDQPAGKRTNSWQDSEPIFPPRSLSRQALTPSPNQLGLLNSARDDAGSPYAWDRRASQDALMPSSALGSPTFPDGSVSPGPSQATGFVQSILKKTGYAQVPERYDSPDITRSPSYDSYSSDVETEKTPDFPNRQTHIDDGERWVRRVELRDPQGPSVARSAAGQQAASSTNARPNRTSTADRKTGRGMSKPSAVSPERNPSGSSLVGQESRNTTPRAHRVEIVDYADEPLFANSPVGPASRALRPSRQTQQPESNGEPKRMTKAQFQALQRRSTAQSDKENASDDGYDDDDEVERVKQMVAQRRKQEANMAIYRQQMKKVTGGGPTALPADTRPTIDRGASAPAGFGFHLGGIGGTPPAEMMRSNVDEDEDDEVPLGILQAHGFPSSTRAPTRPGDSDPPYQRRTSVAGSVAPQGSLPPFARKLPADPYFGAGLVNQPTRESFALHPSAASVAGGAPQQPQVGRPGGLVGVIAGEERARAARRGSPTPQMLGLGNASLPLPSNMPQVSRAMSMGNLAPPQVFTPSGGAAMPMMPPMPVMPGTLDGAAQQQMQHFMQVQMQFMQSMLQMQAQMGQATPSTPGIFTSPPTDYLSVHPDAASRPISMASHQSYQTVNNPNQARAMTMMNPPAGWTGVPNAHRPVSAMPVATPLGPGPGYTPSIAPSERSNVGMPTRYRPVSQAGDAFGDPGRSHSMTSSLTLHAFTTTATQPPPPPVSHDARSSTIRVVDKPKGTPPSSTRQSRVLAAPAQDEDDGWAEMLQKRDARNRKKSTTTSTTTTMAAARDAVPALGDLYRSLD